MESRREEIVNSITHYIGVGLSVIGLIFLSIHAYKIGEKGYFISSIIYGLALIFLYSMSGTYHILKNEKLKRNFRKLDHMGIYILIAASYTPYIFTVLEGRMKWIIFISQWVLTLLGIIFKIYFTGRFGAISTLIYLAMGWMIVLVLKDVKLSLDPLAFRFLLQSGIAYSVGVIFYATKKLNYSHAIWHIFVMVGSLFNYLSIYNIMDKI